MIFLAVAAIIAVWGKGVNPVGGAQPFASGPAVTAGGLLVAVYSAVNLYNFIQLGRAS